MGRGAWQTAAHRAAKSQTQLKWLSMHTPFFIHSSVDGLLGCFCILAIINSASVNIDVHIYFQILVFSGIYSNTCGFSQCRRHVLGWRYFHRGWLDIWDPPTGSQLTQVKRSQRETKLYFLNCFSCSEKGHHWSISTYVSSPLVIQRWSVNIC